MTAIQQSATSLRPLDWAKYIRARISFWKQLPPKPTLEFKNLFPILVSSATHFLTYKISASYDSHNIAMLFIEETL